MARALIVPTDTIDDVAAVHAPAGDTLGWLTGAVNRRTVADLLYQVIDPEIGINIVDLGLIYGVDVADGNVGITMSLTTPGCPLAGYIEDSIRRALWGLPGINDIDVNVIWEPAWGPELMSAQAKRELGWG